MSLTEQRILDALKKVEDPELHISLVDLNMIRNINIEGEKVDLDVILTIQGCPLKATIHDDVVNAVKSVGAKEVEVRFGSMTDQERAELTARLRGGQPGQTEPGAISPILSPESEVTFIAVTSGKGGVGKSTVTVNLATALARLGKRVGIVDADIYGFSVPDMMGIDQRPTVIQDLVLPVERFGVKVISMGFFVEDNSPVIWRGPMLGKMLRNFFSEIHWGELDYLLLDLPPGTGDVALDVHQMIPQSKEVIVTTPHATAAFVAARAGAMAVKTGHEIIGVVENMSYFECGKCGEQEAIFGQGGGEKLAAELGTTVLAQIPLGQPNYDPNDPNTAPSVYEENSKIGSIYLELARNMIN
ncbi:ATP-binding protein [Ammoniphilus oxalaticus]|uniref:Iron-sulfur cluster carrier protein n=1 Tax=Ammoniphilus oxalaticus TaxID=66863 RepID=A0A419SFV0_9BACL|nr:Mrp/NBP35 family ATP-binding protein [Ammoniphilus oxalaticus]RKD22664.1 ATP-binding protein [Ammoniphilus oxalaticus]